ncbi:MAG: formate dehydrogenase accessory sulfurtransferase FdhD, partial [Bacillota bacterium]|nr:formate dehydrogenase accessory sulfurtransferase FdhD [Bacillota bacterium]
EAVRFLCTPRGVRELAVGWLFTQGLILHPREILSLRGCDSMRQIAVQAEPDRWEEREGWRRILTSGCGGGVALARGWEEKLPPVGDGFNIGKKQLQNLMRLMLKKATLYQLTGGIHSAALVDQEKILVHFEDIGRHNAVDKVIGDGLLQQLDFSRLALLTTGRVSSEMALKAAQARISVVASLSIPSTLALEIAQLAGLTLVGRALSPSPYVYTCSARIREEGESEEVGKEEAICDRCGWGQRRSR